MALTFTVLGAVRAWRDDTELDLGPVSPRTLLAVLLATPGRPVRRADLIDVLWPVRPPATAANVVHQHVVRLRRALEPGLAARQPGTVLPYTAEGYRIETAAESIDLSRFRRRRDQARTAADPGTALGHYAAALALWQGPVAAGVRPESRAHPVIVALDREELATVAEAAAVAAETGRWDRLLPALLAAAAHRPLHEPLHARLIQALAATSGPAAALSHYAELRRRLIGEVGTEPGPELREAQRRVLSADGPPPEPGPRTRPAQLPAPLPVFAGRRAEVERVLALLPPGRAPETVVISSIGGMAGVGKTTLAIRLGHLLADRFPDGQLYVDLRGFDRDEAVLDPSDALRGFLDALGVPSAHRPADRDALTARYRGVLAGRRMLIVLDNARDAAQVRPLLPATGGSLVLVTSRDRLTGLAAHPVALDVLPPADAAESLARRVGADRVAAEPEAAGEIVRRTAGLPLALAVVAARAVAHPDFTLADLAGEMRATAGSLDAFTDTDPASDARAVFSWSYRALTPPAARLFRLLALHPGPEITRPAAAALAGGPLDELLGAHLLTEPAAGRYVFHDLLRDYARELVAEDPPGERRAATERLLDHLRDEATAAAFRLGPLADGLAGPATVDGPDAHAWFTAEWPVLAAAVELAAEQGFDDHAWRIAWAVERFHERGGRWPEWLRSAEHAVRAADRLGDPAARAYARRGLGGAYALLRRYDEAYAHLEAARSLFAAAGNEVGEAYTRYGMGWVRTRQGRYAEALAAAEPALATYQRLGHDLGAGDALNLIAWLRVLLGDPATGLRLGRQGLDRFRSIGEIRGQSQIWDTIAYALHHLGRYRAAAEAYGQAIRLFRADGDRYNEGCTWDRLGDTRAAAGDRRGARRAWRAAYRMVGELDPEWAAEVRSKLGDVFHISHTVDSRPLARAPGARG